MSKLCAISNLFDVDAIDVGAFICISDMMSLSSKTSIATFFLDFLYEDKMMRKKMTQAKAKKTVGLSDQDKKEKALLVIELAKAKAAKAKKKK